MNTGIADAVNLAWKLAAVVQGSATPALVDTYEPERIAFARRLVTTTDQAFTAVTSPAPWPDLSEPKSCRASCLRCSRARPFAGSCSARYRKRRSITGTVA